MSRQRGRREDVKPSLFPFLCILTGVMGVLTLVVSGMAMVSLRGADMLIEGSSADTGKTAVYIECQAEALVVHPERRRIAAEEIPAEDGAWARLVQEVETQAESRYLLFLVRPGATRTFEKALLQVNRDKIEVGYDAIYDTGDVLLRAAPPHGTGGAR